MRSIRRRLTKSASEWFSLPSDVLVGTSRVSVTNGETLIVEHMKKLLRVDETEIQLLLPEDLRLTLAGKNFEVVFVSEDEVHISGVVEHIQYHRDGR